VNAQSTTDHLANQLNAAGVSWKSYQEDISGDNCPLFGTGTYATKHNPFVFFQDLTNGFDPTNADCIAHNRPLTGGGEMGDLEADLQNGTVARYNFITPNLCHDMHGDNSCPGDEVKQGDDWLTEWIPKIMASSAYQQNGAIFITWDESEGGGEPPIGMIVISPLAKGGGYSNTIAYDHSSMLRTSQTIFGVGPFLRAAASATDLGDLFTSFP
jgi:phospholipase C